MTGKKESRRAKLIKNVRQTFKPTLKQQPKIKYNVVTKPYHPERNKESLADFVKKHPIPHVVQTGKVTNKK